MALITNSELPTLYQYYAQGGISSGLSAENPYFTLNGINISIYSGAMHYFRVPKEYWADRLRKMRAAGLNTVETYIPWNLHEPQISNYDFGDGESAMSQFLDVREFLKTVVREDLFAIIRPGPYICAEWEFGGLPSWLLREDDIKVRTSDQKFMKHVERYFAKLLQILAVFQFTLGGPIIGFQIENEYGSTESKKESNIFIPDQLYLRKLRKLFNDYNIVELLFTSDSPTLHAQAGSLPGILQTANFAMNPEKEFNQLKKFQKNKPSMAMEFWTGWFDHWTEHHHLRNNSEFEDNLRRILAYPASVNLYMFHGGTNWGFYNGANIPTGKSNIVYQPDTTSYDYDAPLSEAGDYTEKYYIVKRLLEAHNSIKTKLPEPPKLTPRGDYRKIKIESQLKYDDFIATLPYTIKSERLLPMELLPINNSGQSYGYIIYRKKLSIATNSVIKIKGYIHDFAMILINGKLISKELEEFQDIFNFGYWQLKDATLELPETLNATLDIVVANLGRNNFGSLQTFKQFKGLVEEVYINEELILNWTLIPLEFKRDWVKSLSLKNWSAFDAEYKGPSLCKTNLVITDRIYDTFIDMSTWNMGIVIVNNFILGRHMHLGPQQSLYLPAPFLKIGDNEIIIFEHFRSHRDVSFSTDPIYYTKNT